MTSTIHTTRHLLILSFIYCQPNLGRAFNREGGIWLHP
jgi:hypothetical protein